ncbi:MAG: hypothetical protein CV090_13585 [Nitrospira sp. WS238]|nr:hypothetical protein [Nitrospira sp. WS238]
MVDRHFMTCCSAVFLVILCVTSFPQQVSSTTLQSYDFKVFLGKDEIGRQRFDVSSEGERTQIRVDAQFTVKFLYIPVYTYRHTNLESWEGACLRQIRSETDDNGDAFLVDGIYRNGQMHLQTRDGNWNAEGCVKTFAYWNPEWIVSDRLLNSQTGELQAVEIRVLGEETIPVLGIPTPTTHRRIITDKFTIDLWYTLSGRWVALQSTTAKGNVLRYTLQ